MRKYKSIYENFKLALKDIRKIKNYLIFSIIIFSLFLIIGILYPNFFKEQIIKLINSLIKKTEGMNFIELFIFIAGNNIQVSFFSMILGIFFGILPILTLIVNGYVLGFIINKSITSEGIFIIWRLFPHGIFEIPAILISISLGIKLGINLKDFKKNLKSSLRIFVFIIIPLLIIAGIIESLLVFVS